MGSNDLTADEERHIEDILDGARARFLRPLIIASTLLILYSLLVILELAPPAPELKAFLASRISSLSPTCPGPPAN
jgi:hypothetical protein